MNDPKFANKDSSETRFIRLLWFLPPNSLSNFDLLSFGFHCVRFDSSREDKSGHVSFVTRQVVLCRISTHLASRICRRTSCLQLWRYSRLLKSKEKQLYLDSRGGGCIFLLPLTTSTILLLLLEKLPLLTRNLLFKTHPSQISFRLLQPISYYCLVYRK